MKLSSEKEFQRINKKVNMICLPIENFFVAQSVDKYYNILVGLNFINAL